jgi:hypothetical protein
VNRRHSILTDKFWDFDVSVTNAAWGNGFNGSGIPYADQPACALTTTLNGTRPRTVDQKGPGQILIGCEKYDPTTQTIMFPDRFATTPSVERFVRWRNGLAEGNYIAGQYALRDRAFAKREVA